VRYTVFYNDAINSGELNLQADYRRWKQKLFSFCKFPYVLDAATKSRILQV
jgi:hypothetical protein